MSLRSILFDLFHGQEFQEVKGDVKTILANTTQMMADVALMTVAVATLAQSVAALDLASLTTKVDALLMNSKSIWTMPTSFSAINDVVQVPVMVKGDPLEESIAFGFSVAFDPAELRFIAAHAGNATLSWQAVDGNETAPGQVVVGGFAGIGAPIPGVDISEYVTLEFEVLVDVDVQFALDVYVDDLTGVQPEPYYGAILKTGN